MPTTENDIREAIAVRRNAIRARAVALLAETDCDEYIDTGSAVEILVAIAALPMEDERTPAENSGEHCTNCGEETTPTICGACFGYVANEHCAECPEQPQWAESHPSDMSADAVAEEAELEAAEHDAANARTRAALDDID